MFPHEPAALTTLFIGVLGVLVIASSVGAFLRWKLAANGPNATIDNLNARVKAWWVMVIVLGIAFAIGKIGVIVLFAIVSFLSLREFATLVYTRRGDHRALAIAFFVVLPLQYVLVGMDWYGLYAILIPVYVFLFLPIFAALSRDTTRFLERAAKLMYALMLCVYCVSYVPALLTLHIPGYAGRNVLLIAWLIVVVQASDVLQYVFGKLFGRHRIAPALSPSKTIEGFAGGVVSSSAIGCALYPLTPFTPAQAALILELAERTLEGLRNMGDILPARWLNSLGLGGPGVTFERDLPCEVFTRVGETFIRLLRGEVTWDAHTSPVL